MGQLQLLFFAFVNRHAFEIGRPKLFAPLTPLTIWFLHDWEDDFPAARAW